MENTRPVVNSVPTILLLTLIGALFGVTASGVTPESCSPMPHRTGEELYRAACSSCHGVDGKGQPRSRVGFELPLPDFTDCRFAAREPDSDWLAVSHLGGPARGFSTLMPAFGEALSAEELERVMAEVRSFCENKAWPRGELNLPRPLFTEKAFVEDEVVWTVEVPVEGQNAFQNEIVYEQRFGPRSQFELIVPFGWQENSEGSMDGGVGDVALGMKYALFHSLDKGSIFSAGGEVILPTGNSGRGFGKGTTVFEPFFAYGQLIPSDFFLHALLAFEFPADTEVAENELLWSLALGRTFTQKNWGRAWSPMLEVIAARELESGQDFNWDLLPQMQVTLSRRQHVMLNVGVRLPVTDSSSRDASFLVYLLWDWYDGGFFEAW